MNATPDQIELLGSLDGNNHYTEDLICELINSEVVTLSRDSQFLGRTGTRLHSQGGNVLKIRKDMALGVKTASRWLRTNVFEREQEVTVHHPAKAWFLHYGPESVVAGNVAPEMRPLHIIFKESKDVDTCLEHLGGVIDLYARAASDYKLRLDEGLSNFGLDADGKLYYLDDDIYRWDRFTGFCHGLGVYLRSLEQLDNAAVGKLGEMAAEIWTRRYPDPHCPNMIARLLRDLPKAGAAQGDKLEALVEGLESLTRKARANRRAEREKEKSKSNGKGNGKETKGNGEQKSNGEAKAKPKKPATFEEVVSSDRFAVLADIHANAAALRVAMDKLKELGVTSGVVLGDVVGYGPYPRECIDIVREAGFAALKGNHDHAAASGYFGRGVNRPAAFVVEWSREQLSADELDWLESLPTSLQAGDWYAVHGSPMDPNYFYGYVYHMTAGSNLDYLESHGIRHCFHGHSHMASVYFRRSPGGEEFDDGGEQTVSDYSQSLICPGSVGKTRGGTPGADLAVIDRTKGSLQLFRLDYPMEETLGEMERLDFPEILLTRLKSGM